MARVVEAILRTSHPVQVDQDLEADALANAHDARELEQIYELVFADNAVPMAVVTLDGRFLRTNARFVTSSGFTADELSRVVVAYEPVWAIGTGLTCEPAVAQKVHKGIRGWFEMKYGVAAADAVRIQYGGSVTPETVDDLMRQPDIDGCLVGGASLDPQKFARIINYQA